MRLSFEDHQKGLIVGIAGKLDAITAANFKEEILARISDNEKVVLFDLSNLHYLSSAGIRVFFLVARRLRETGGTMHFSGLNQDIMRVFEMIELQSEFNIFSDVEKALLEI